MKIKLIPKSNSQLYCQIHYQKEMELICEDCQLPICSLCVPQHPSHKFSIRKMASCKSKKKWLQRQANQAKKIGNKLTKKTLVIDGKKTESPNSFSQNCVSPKSFPEKNVSSNTKK